MIYGQHATSWRTDAMRRNAKRRVLWAWCGLVVVLATAAAFYGLMLA